jgi:TolB-like protein/DNA-binding winged helix-turn-helix (wHTH) protein/tetratricopeptide (TPR) repeat protein
MSEARRYLFGPFLLIPDAYKLLRDGEPIALTPKAFHMLLVLVENHGRVLEKEELIRAVWPDTFVEEGNLCVTISLLRKVFGKEHPYIKTVSKHGYWFDAEIKQLSAETETVRPAGAALIPLDREVIPSGIEHRKLEIVPRFRFSRVLTLSCVVVIMATIFLAFGFWPRVRAHAARTSEIRSLAVLPFETFGTDSGIKYLGLGMADALITKLASTGRIATRPTRAMQKYQGTSQDPRSVGYEQRVDAVLDGQIQLSGDRVRVTAQLIRVADGKHLWADTFDEEFTNVFAVEDTLSADVVSSIRFELTGKEKEPLAKHPERSREAYAAYLTGRFFWNERTGAGLKKGLDYFQRAIAIDPSYAEAYSGIADSYAMLGLYQVLPPNDAFPKAKAAATKALSLDNSLAEAHSTLGFVHFYYDWDGAAAEREFTTALEENPNYAIAHSWRGFSLAVMGRFNEAVREEKLAVEDDPLSASIGTNAGWVNFLAGQNEQAISILEKVIEIDPNFPRAHFRLGNIYEHMNQYRRAIAEYEKAVELSGGDTYYEASLGHAYAMAGMISEATKNLHELEDLSRIRYVSPYAIALVCFGIGEADRGYLRLERAIADRSTSMAYLNVDPTLNNLRSDPRFVAILREANLQKHTAR